MRSPYLVLAGNIEQARQWMEKHHLKFAEVRYAGSESSVRGYKDALFVIVGTFFERPDARGIYESVALINRAKESPLTEVPVPRDWAQPIRDTKPRGGMVQTVRSVTGEEVAIQMTDAPPEEEEPKPKRLFKKIVVVP